jgi:hypothetical protein
MECSPQGEVQNNDEQIFHPLRVNFIPRGQLLAWKTTFFLIDSSHTERPMYHHILRRQVVRIFEVGVKILGLVWAQVGQETPDVVAIDWQRRIAHPVNAEAGSQIKKSCYA